MMVRIREPLTAQQLETTTERWLVIDHIPTAVPTVSPCLSVTSGSRARVGDSVLIGLTLYQNRSLGPKQRFLSYLRLQGKQATGKSGLHYTEVPVLRVVSIRHPTP